MKIIINMPECAKYWELNLEGMEIHSAMLLSARTPYPKVDKYKVISWSYGKLDLISAAKIALESLKEANWD